MENFRVVAPTRVDLAGGTLDIWPIHTLIGKVRTINLAIDLHASASFRFTPAKNFSLTVQSSNESFEWIAPMTLTECQALKPALKFPVWVVNEYLSIRKLPQFQVTMTLETEAPLRSGLGGSSCLAVAMSRGLSRIFNEYMDLGWQWRLLDWVKDVEAAFIKTPTGTQDYLAALFGGLSCFTTAMGVRGREEYPENVLKDLNERLVVLFSGEMHHSGMSNWEIFKAAFEANSEMVKGLGNIKTVADHLHSELLSGNLSWKHIGKLLSEEWSVRREVFRVNTPRLDELVEFLHAQKVYGVKVCGAAAGGSLIALVDPVKRKDLIRSCEEKGIQVLGTTGIRQGVQFFPVKKVSDSQFA